MSSPNQARDDRGRFAGGGHGAEAGARDAGRYSVTAHQGQASVAARTGRLLQAGQPTPNPAAGRSVRNVVAERTAMRQATDERHYPTRR